MDLSAILICSRLPIVPKMQLICFRERTCSNEIHSILSSQEDIELIFKTKGKYNPISHLKGMSVTNHESTIVREVYIPHEDGNFTVQVNWGSLLKEHEVITAELKRW